MYIGRTRLRRQICVIVAVDVCRIATDYGYVPVEYAIAFACCVLLHLKLQHTGLNHRSRASRLRVSRRFPDTREQ